MNYEFDELDSFLQVSHQLVGGAEENETLCQFVDEDGDNLGPIDDDAIENTTLTNTKFAENRSDQYMDG